MTDGMEPNPDWDVSDFLHTDGTHAFKHETLDGTVNPKSIQQSYGLESPDQAFDFHSDCSASPDRNIDADSSTVDLGPLKANRRHAKAFSVSSSDGPDHMPA